MEIVHLHDILDRLVAKLVGCSVDGTGFYAGARHPETESKFVVIAAVASLGERGASEFTGPEDQGVVEHAA